MGVPWLRSRDPSCSQPDYNGWEAHPGAENADEPEQSRPFAGLGGGKSPCRLSLSGSVFAILRDTIETGQSRICYRAQKDGLSLPGTRF